MLVVMIMGMAATTVVAISSADFVSNYNNYSNTQIVQRPAPRPILLNSCAILDVPNAVYLLTMDLHPTDDGVCFTIASDRVTLDGNGHSIIFENGEDDTGVFLQFLSSITVKNLTIVGAEWGIDLVGVTNGIIKDNIILSAGTSGIETLAFNSIFQNNTVVASPNSLFLGGTSQNNQLINNKISSGRSGIILSGIGNVVSGGFVKNSQEYGLDIATSDGSDMGNTLNGVVITNNNPEVYDIRFHGDPEHIVYLNNMPLIGKYRIDGPGGKLVVRNSTGEIKFLEALSGSGKSLSRAISVSDNLAVVDSVSNPGLNKKAQITLNGLAGRFNSPIILKDGQECPADICAFISPLGSEPAIFEVEHWTAYSLGEKK